MRTIVVEIIAFLFILLFVYAALMKLADVEKFQAQIGQSPLLTDVAGFVAWSIPGAELLVAALMAWPRFRRAGMVGAFGLMLMFTLYIIAILNFSERIPCSCGGVLESLNWGQHLVFNFVFVLLSLTGGVLLSQKKQTMRQQRER